MLKETLNVLPEKGVYTLIIFLSEKSFMKIGKLGEFSFPKGYYAYTGSALGPNKSLQNRVCRHLRKEKRLRWHIDYFLQSPKATVTAVVAIETDKKLECKVNKLIAKKLNGTVLVEGFGASDCKEKCKSHLLFLDEMENVEFETLKLYKENFGEESSAIFLV